MMKRILLFITFYSIAIFFTNAQERRWTMEECMQYAVEHSPAIKKQVYTNDTYEAEYASSIASFLPSLDASAGAQYNFGRTIDQKTNLYTNTTTFYNSYGLSTSLPLFNGGQLVNQWRMAGINRRKGLNDIQKVKDDLALNTMAAFIDVVYYEGTRKYATEKLGESSRVLYKTQRLEELGLKGKADLALIEAQVAEDDYNLTRQQNLFETAMLTLKNYMNYPAGKELYVDTLVREYNYGIQNESAAVIFEQARETNPVSLQAAYQVKAYEMNHLIQKGRFFPSVSLFAGINTNYYNDLKAEKEAISFKSQFKNNRGEYVGISVNIPLFSRLNRLTDVRRAKNNIRIAREQQVEILRQLQTSIEKALLDKEGYAKEAVQMEKKQDADSYAYQMTLRKYEEGLMSAIDLQTSANALLMSRANLLHRKLMYVLKCKEVDYYKGMPLVEADIKE